MSMVGSDFLGTALRQSMAEFGVSDEFILPVLDDFESRVKEVLDANLDFALGQPHLFDLMFLQTRKGARQFPRDFVAGKSPTGNRFAELVAEGIRRGVFRRVDVWDVVFETGALLQGLVMLYLGERVDATEQEFRAICHRAMRRYLNGIRKAKR